MKNSILIKSVVVLPLIIFVDYIIMVILGCATCLFGFGEDFYCSSYCLVGKIIILLSAIFFGYLIYPDLIKLFKSKVNGASTKE